MFHKNKTPAPKADVQDGALVLYLPNALKPCVWRMGLDVLVETSIEIDERDGIHILATRDINGVTKSIAGFNDLNDAQNALSLTLNALMSGSGSSKGFSFNIPSILKILKWIAIAIVVLFLGSYLLGGSDEVIVENVSTAASDASPLDENGQIKLGVPIDVDSLFQEN